MMIVKGRTRPGWRRISLVLGEAGALVEERATIREVCLVGDPARRYRFRRQVEGQGEAERPARVRGGVA